MKGRPKRRNRPAPRLPNSGARAAEKDKLQQAIQLHQQGQLAAAEKLYRDVLHGDPRHSKALQFLGVIAGQRGESQQAVDLIDQALAINPDDAAGWSNRGNALLELKRHMEALESYDRALAINPGHADALHNRGLTLHTLDRTEEALDSYDRALAIRPDYPHALNHRGIALCKLRRQLEGIAAFRRALAIQPGVAEFHANLGKALLELRQLEAAEKSLRRALQIEKSAAVFESLATTLYQQRKFPEAMQTYRDWQAFEPDNPIPRHMVTAGSDAAPKRAGDQYVAELFDKFAGSFETTLLGLGYRVPELLTAQITAVRGTDTAPLRILDAGCGTGLAAPLLKPLASRLVGVDLSSGMVDKARARELYDELVVAELCAFMASRPAAFDLVLLADTLVYFGALEQAFATAHDTLTPGGILAFAVESRAGSGPDHQLELHGRYSHRPDYVTRLLTASGYTLHSLEFIVIRRELDTDVAGIAVVARRNP
ncbi:MAG: tetratricopeptide repeat protein [Gammaproteobacteria bacterium]